MINREYLIEQLNNNNFIDDSGASYEATIFYNIACPYICGCEKRLCKSLKAYESPTRDMCFECKEKWLDSYVDQ